LNTPDGPIRRRVFYANNIKSGADTVTLNLAADSTWTEVYLTEYYGVNLSNAIDARTGASGNAGAVSSGKATTTSAGGIIFGSCVRDWVSTAGTGLHSALGLPR
jgi:hypothetical protein